MIGYVYKTTNNITGEYYFGKRLYASDKSKRTIYYGSGKHLKASIAKYGLNNFTKDILKQFSNEQDMLDFEANLIDIHSSDSLCLNKMGGKRFGGIYEKGKCNTCGEHAVLYTGKCMKCIVGKSPKEYCDACQKVTHRYKDGRCKKCVSKNAHSIKYCEFCGKETVHFGNKCKSHSLALKKNVDGTIALLLKKGGQSKVLFQDISFIKGTTHKDNLLSEVFTLPKDSLKVKCLDTFTNLEKVIINKKETEWLKITYKYDNRKDHAGKSIIVTYDHPLPLISGEVVKAEELRVGDKLVPSKSSNVFLKHREIISIEKYEQTADSYDIQTESHYFNLNNDLLSHNCRATLANWYEKGGFEPLDENDTPIFEGRCNMGAISLHFPLILKKAQLIHSETPCTKALNPPKSLETIFFEQLHYYCELIRNIHIRTFETFAKKKAGTNPLAFCQGGLLNGHFDPEEEIGREFLKPMTATFGITALNETQYLYNGKSLVEDNSFAIEILKYMEAYKTKCTNEDKILYALYATPAESLCSLQVEQFRKMYGEQKGITDKPYTTNSFHCAVYEDITPIQKQDLEYQLYHYCTGGAIQYCRYPIGYNIESMVTLVRRAMKLGFYEGINLQLNYCEECGHGFIDGDKCPKCNSIKFTRIERMNGYLGYTNVKGKTMYADHKLAEFKDRVSM